MPVRGYRVSGRVQGVGYRFFTRHTAASLGLSGYVRNLEDGSVEVAASGNTGQLDVLEAALREGPRWAVVERLERFPVDAEALPHGAFLIR